MDINQFKLKNWGSDPRFKSRDYTFKTLYAIQSIINHWVDTEIIISKDASLESYRMADMLPIVTPDNFDSISANIKTARFLHDNLYIPMQRYSCVLLLCSIIEKELKTLIENVIQDKGKQKLNLKDFSGNLIEQVDSYLHVFHSLKITECRNYNAVIDLQKLRNCIVHSFGGLRDSDKEKIIQIAKNWEGVRINDLDEVEIDAIAVTIFSENSYEFFEWIFEKFNWINVIDRYTKQSTFKRARIISDRNAGMQLPKDDID